MELRMDEHARERALNLCSAATALAALAYGVTLAAEPLLQPAQAQPCPAGSACPIPPGAGVGLLQ